MCMICQSAELSAVCGVKIPMPRFQIAQKVIASYVCNDLLDLEHYGHLIEAEANVVGMYWDDFAKSWSYFLFVNQPNWFWGYEFLETPALECELKGG